MRFCYSCMRQIADNAKDICPYCKEKLNIEKLKNDIENTKKNIEKTVTQIFSLIKTLGK